MPIIVPPEDALLCTVEELKDQLDKTSDADNAELLAYCKAVTAPIEHMCGTILPVTRTEIVTVNGNCIVLPDDRVVSVTSITGWSGGSSTPWTEEALSFTSSYGFRVDTSAGMIRALGGWFSGDYEITYVAGFATVPTNVNLAARIIAANLWETQQSGANLPPVYGEDYDPTLSGPVDIPIPPRARMLLEPYRRSPAIA